jgi:hypothetical protein
MGRYQEGDHVKFGVTHERSEDREWIWLSVDDSDDEQQVVFGQLDSDPVVGTDIKVGRHLAVHYGRVRQHRRSSDFQTD